MIMFEGVSKGYSDGTTVVNNLSFTASEGETLVFLGPSGCGKTTTLRLINRLVEPTSGVISIWGEDIQTLDPFNLRRQIGYAFQHIGLFPHMTVEENIAIVPTLLNWPRKKINARTDELLNMVGLDPAEFRDLYPAKLSGGQRQRVGVARALAADPKAILMDEPFGALDPITRTQIQDEFLEIQKAIRKTIIFVTHDMSEAVKMGDRIAVMQEGEIVQLATPDEILGSPATSFIEEFVGVDRVHPLLQKNEAGV